MGLFCLILRPRSPGLPFPSQMQTAQPSLSFPTASTTQPPNCCPTAQVPTVVDGEMEALCGILGPEGQSGCKRGSTRVVLNAPIDGLPPGGKCEGGRGVDAPPS